MKYAYNLGLKMSVSATVALLIGNLLQLEFTTVAAVIAILSIQETRMKAIIFGKKRLIAGLIAIILSVVLYSVFGQAPLVFGLFLILFIPITSKINVDEGMVPAVVLSTHLLTVEIIDLKGKFN